MSTPPSDPQREERIERERAVRLLSDTVLYAEAQRFVQEHSQLPDRSQLMGLLNFSRNWNDLKNYVENQRQRDWGTRDYYQRFYDDLQKYLRGSLEQRVKSGFDGDIRVNTEALTKKQREDLYQTWTELLAAEFIQHLVADAFGRVGQR